MHGGTSMSLMDCNAIWAAIATRYDLEGRTFASDPVIWYVTAGFIEPRLKKPIPMDADLLAIISKVEEINKDSRKCIIFSEIAYHGLVYAETRVVAVQIQQSPENLQILKSPPLK